MAVLNAFPLVSTHRPCLLPQVGPITTHFPYISIPGCFAFLNCGSFHLSSSLLSDPQVTLREKDKGGSKGMSKTTSVLMLTHIR